MDKQQLELVVLNPRGVFDCPRVVDPSPRLSALDGKRIGILKFGTGAGLAEQLLPYLIDALKKRLTNIQFRLWPAILEPESRQAGLNEIAENSDCVIVMLGFTGTSSARTARDAVDLEKMGKPVAFMVTRPFTANARFIVRREGLSDISLAVVPIDSLPLPEEIEKLELGEKGAEDVIRALTQWIPHPQEESEVTEDRFRFTGSEYSAALDNMERYFLQHGWSDGLPIVPPTPNAVANMLAGTDLAAEHLVGIVEPGGGKATIEKIAVSAVMAGCRPQYMPVLIAAVEAITDPAFNLREVQCTSCNMAPLLVLSSNTLTQELNINNGFSAMGPGWKANSTIGRALRLIMTNLGHTWPGINDMKTLGSPFKSISLIAENERAFNGDWQPLRVAEGFGNEESTISVMPAMSWQPDIVQPEPPTVKRIVEYISKQGKVKHDRLVGNWGMDNLVVICTSTFDCIRREGCSRQAFQKAVYNAIQIPSTDFLNGRDVKEIPAFSRLPLWIKEKCLSSPEALVPILAKPENIKVCVTGGAGPYGISYISTFGYGPAHFVTKPIRLPGNWANLVVNYRGWESPTVPG